VARIRKEDGVVVPSRQLERLRGRVLDEGEVLHVASTVQLVQGPPTDQALGRSRVMLALTDRRLLVIRAGWFSRARVMAQWPNHELRFSVSTRRIGSRLVNVDLAGGERLSFEWLGGHPAREWGYLIHR
jgi:hypothetical protein